MRQEKNKPDVDKMLDILGAILGGTHPNKIFVCTDEEQGHELDKILKRPSTSPIGKIVKVDFCNKRRI